MLQNYTSFIFHKMNRWPFLFLIISLCFIQKNRAQDYVYFHYNQKNGLPQNSVNDLFWDSSNFLWVSTEDGLTRFDGHSFYQFNINNTPGIHSDRFRWILRTIDGTTVTTTVDGNLFELSQHNPKPYLTSNQTYQKYSGILPDKEQLKKLISIDQEHIIANQWRYFPTQFIQIGRSTYVLGNEGIYKLSDLKNSDTIKHDGSITRIFNIGDYAYATDGNRIYHIDELNKKLIPVSFASPVRLTTPFKIYYQPLTKKACVIIDQKLYLWSVGSAPDTIHSEFKINLHNQTIGEASNVSYNEQSNMIAIGSLTNGLHIFKPKLFKTLSPDTWQPKNGYYANISLNDSTVIDSYGDEISSSSCHSSGFDLTNVNTHLLYLDKSNRLWSSRADTLYYQTKGQKRQGISLHYPDYIRTFAATGDSLLVLTNHHAFVLKGTKILYSAPLEYNGQPFTLKSMMFAIFANQKWILGGEKGIFELTLNAKAQLSLMFKYEQVRFLTEINGMIMGGSYGNGWFVISKGKIIRLPVDARQYLNKVHSIMSDGKDRLFLSTNNGLFSTTMKELNNYLNGLSPSMYFHYFDDDEGIENTEFNGGCYPPAVHVKNGYFSFANMAGLVWFKPEMLRLKTGSSGKVIYLDAIEADLVSIPYTDTLFIDPQTENIRLKFSVIYWNNPYNIRLDYKLKGTTQNWTPLDPENPKLSFTNLTSGEFTLVIRSQTGFNNNDISYLTIPIVKKPRFHETVWFIVLCILLLFIIIFGINMLYNKRLLTQNLHLEKRVSERTSELQKANLRLSKSEQDLTQAVNVKNKLISIISHDIVTPLKFISLVSRNYKTDKKDSNNSQNEIIREIHHTSQRLHDNSLNILNWVRYQNNLIKVHKTSIAPFALVEELTELFREVAAMRKNTIINEVEMDDIIVNDKNILTIMIHNILSNAVKYTHSSNIIISSEHKKDDCYIITITDDGNGISENNLKRIESIRNKAKTNIFEDSAEGTGLGYIILFELAELTGADIKIQSSADKGTQISIILN